MKGCDCTWVILPQTTEWKITCQTATSSQWMTTRGRELWFKKKKKGVVLWLPDNQILTSSCVSSALWVSLGKSPAGVKCVTWRSESLTVCFGLNGWVTGCKVILHSGIFLVQPRWSEMAENQQSKTSSGKVRRWSRFVKIKEQRLISELNILFWRSAVAPRRHTAEEGQIPIYTLMTPSAGLGADATS